MTANNVDTTLVDFMCDGSVLQHAYKAPSEKTVKINRDTSMLAACRSTQKTCVRALLLWQPVFAVTAIDNV